MRVQLLLRCTAATSTNLKSFYAFPSVAVPSPPPPSTILAVCSSAAPRELLPLSLSPSLPHRLSNGRVIRRHVSDQIHQMAVQSGQRGIVFNSTWLNESHHTNRHSMEEFMQPSECHGKDSTLFGHRKLREAKQQPCIFSSGHQLSCCLVSLVFP